MSGAVHTTSASCYRLASYYNPPLVPLLKFSLTRMSTLSSGRGTDNGRISHSGDCISFGTGRADGGDLADVGVRIDPIAHLRKTTATTEPRWTKKNNHRPAGSTDAPSFFLSHYSGSVSRTPLSHLDGRLDWNKIKVIIHPPPDPPIAVIAVACGSHGLILWYSGPPSSFRPTSS
jgi:hypothetical protein